MSYYKYVSMLHESGFRELGYFSGLHTFLSVDTLVTVFETHGGFQITIDSVAKNIGKCYYCYNDNHVCQLLEAILCE